MADETHTLEALEKAMAELDPSGAPEARLFRKAPRGLEGRGGDLVVLDASYNPMTLAHEAMLQAARALAPAAEHLLLLSAANVDKAQFGASLGQRLAMLLAYAEGSVHLSVGGCSHARFVDKAAALAPLYPVGTRTAFIIGYDTLLRLFDPVYYRDMAAELRELFGQATFLVANRGGQGVDAIRRFLERPECRPFAEGVRPIGLSDRLAGVSSTRAREALARGGRINHLVPPAVAGAINEMDLYREA